MSIEWDNGDYRTARTRPSDLQTVPTDRDRRRQNHDDGGKFARGNRAAVGRGAKTVIERPEAGLLDTLAEAPDSLAEPSEAVALARDVRTLYRAARRDVACESPMVLTALATWAREAVIAQHLLSKAALEGISTPAGLALVEAAQKAEHRSEKAALQAQGLAVKLATKRGKVVDAHGEVANAFGGEG